jgi:hypothetical protein
VAPAPTAAPIPIPKLAPQRRWRPGLVALAVALVATGGLSAAYAITLVGSTNSYIAVYKEVQAGAKITDADVTSVRMSTDPGLRPIPYSRKADVVGKFAAVRLSTGTLLTEDQLTNVPIGGKETYLLSLGLSQNKVPAQRVRSGDRVVLIALPAQNFVQSNNTPTGPPQTFSATVADVSTPTQNGTVYVNVAVAQADGASIAILAAADRIYLALGG